MATCQQVALPLIGAVKTKVLYKKRLVKKNNAETMAPNHVTGVVLPARSKTKIAVVLGHVTVIVNIAGIKNEKEAEVETVGREGVRAKNVKEVEAETGVVQIDIVEAKAKRGGGGRGHAQEIVTHGKGHRLVSVGASEVG